MSNVAHEFVVPPDTQNTQSRVASPRASAWVSANAGSGKTYVLSRRVLRLLLDGVRPEAILCLTYTKAAAAEMRHRVTAILAGWARHDAAKLEAELADLLGTAPTEAERQRARSLFAHALDTPGGLKVNTIHAFCESVLQRFPREAGVPVDFAVVEEQAAAQLLNEARETVLAEGLKSPDATGAAVRTLFGSLSDSQIEAALSQCLAKARILGPILQHPKRAAAAMRTSLGLREGETLAALEAEVLGAMLVPVSEWPAIFSICPPDPDKSRFEDRLARIDPASPTIEELFGAYLKGDGTVPAKFPKAAFARSDPGLAERLLSEAQRLAALYDRRQALVIAQNSEALTQTLAAIIARYEAQKRARSLMDFDDLVARTARLLSDRALGPWVRYKLDAGIDHVLVDESQDTNPEQWAVIDALIEDYFAGEGAAARPKTVFAVGDPKQSIYSFQGAEPALFAEKGRSLKRAADRAGHLWHGETLNTSFRTLPEVLEGVDLVFNRTEIAPALLAEPESIRHEAARRTPGGLIEVWSPVEKPQQLPPGDDWPTAPIEGLASAPRQLATTIAATIARWIETGAPLGPRGRPVRPEDILILVQNRQGVFPEIVRALKQRDISSPGSDRLPVSAHIAIDDLLGLADVLLNPRDDLMLAAVLRSPLFALSEDELYTLAHGRAEGESVWDRLQSSTRDPARTAFERLSGLRARLDFDRPYEFFAHVLYAQGGLQQFHRRLGEEVDEVVAEFLDLALEHENTEQPSLTGFLAAMRASEVVIKRDLAANAGGVRVMTVHGAKGLEAPVVILADAATPPRPVRDTVYFGTHGHTLFLLYCPNSGAHCQASRPLRAAVEAKSTAEYWRNLYVAMTRAEDALYVAGAKGENTKLENTWHGVLSAALAEHSDTVHDEEGVPVGLRYPTARADTAALSGVSVEPQRLRRPILLQPPPRRPVVPVETPSGHGGGSPFAEGLATAAERLLDARAARERGIALHALLEHLISVPQELRESVAIEAARTLLPDNPELVESVARRGLTLYAAPHLTHLFGPGSRAEVPFSLMADHNGKGIRLEGRIDRIIVDQTGVLVVDYKSDAAVPVSVTDLPPAYARQLGLYALAAERLFPARDVTSAILWTSTGALMHIPSSQLAPATAGVTIA